MSYLDNWGVGPGAEGSSGSSNFYSPTYSTGEQQGGAFPVGDAVSTIKDAYNLISGVGTKFGGTSLVGPGANWLASTFPSVFGVQSAAAPALSAMGGMGEMAGGLASTQVGAGAAIAPFLSAALPIVGIGLGAMLPAIMSRNDRPPGFYGAFTTDENPTQQRIGDSFNFDESGSSFKWGELTPDPMVQAGRTMHERIQAGLQKMRDEGVNIGSDLAFQYVVDPFDNGLYARTYGIGSDGSDMANEGYNRMLSQGKYADPDSLALGVFSEVLNRSTGGPEALRAAMADGLTLDELAGYYESPDWSAMSGMPGVSVNQGPAWAAEYAQTQQAAAMPVISSVPVEGAWTNPIPYTPPSIRDAQIAAWEASGEEGAPLFQDGGAVGAFEVEGVEDDGRSDTVDARLSVGEFVIPADVVSALGRGSSDAGAEYLRNLVKETRTDWRKQIGAFDDPR